jgi:hypothetical protein
MRCEGGLRFVLLTPIASFSCFKADPPTGAHDCRWARMKPTAMLRLSNNYDGDLYNSRFSIADHPMWCNNKAIPQFDQRRRDMNSTIVFVRPIGGTALMASMHCASHSSRHHSKAF